jgi:putative peptidoglycan lipid II flippase
VQLLFQHGRFTAADTRATAAALQLYAVGLIGYSAVRIVSPTFYALGRSHVPVIASVAAIALNIVLSVSMAGRFGFGALALATSIAALVNGGVLVWQLRASIGGIEGRHVAVNAVKTTAASGVMALVAVSADRHLPSLISGPGVAAQALRLGLTIAVATIALGATAKLFHISEFDDVVEVVTARLTPRA